MFSLDTCNSDTASKKYSRWQHTLTESDLIWNVCCWYCIYAFRKKLKVYYCADFHNLKDTWKKEHKQADYVGQNSRKYLIIKNKPVHLNLRLWSLKRFSPTSWHLQNYYLLTTFAFGSFTTSSRELVSKFNAILNNFQILSHYSSLQERNLKKQMYTYNYVDVDIM